MKKIYFFLSFLPFITACHSLSIQKSSKNKPPALSQTVIDEFYLKQKARWHYMKGERASVQGLYDQAIESFKEALIYHPDSFALHFRLTNEYLRAGLYLQSFEQCNFLLKEQPDNLNLRFKKAEIYELSGLYGKALNEYHRILKTNPYHTKALYKKALLHIKKTDFSSARGTLKRPGGNGRKRLA